jgi:hypothetical protein
VFFFLVSYFLSLINAAGFYPMSCIFDYKARVLVDTFFCNNFYFMWTNLWYLSIYALTFNIIFLLFKSREIPLPCQSLFVMLIVLLSSLHADWINSYFFLIEYYPVSFKENTLLLNPINKIHPFMLHNSFFFLILYISLTNFTKFQKINILFFTIHKYLRNSFIILLSTLYLGSWWALQEGSWGGWWNWDPSEIFGLFILYRLVLIYHKANCVVYPFFMQFYLRISLTHFLLFYCTMQVNFSLVSHNFGFRSLKSFNPEFYFLIVFIFFSLWVISQFSWLNTLRLFLHNKIKASSSTIYIVLCLFSITFFFSYFNLMHNFLWNTIELRIFLIKFNYEHYINFLIIGLLSFLYRSNCYLSVYSFYLYRDYILLNLFLLRKVMMTSYAGIIHCFFLLFIFNAYATRSDIVDIWSTFLSDYCLETCYYFSLNSSRVESSFNLVKQSSTLEGKSFDLAISGGLLTQLYFPAGDIDYYMTKVNDGSSILLNSIFFYLIFFIFNFFRSRLRLI